jgi:predicted nucleotidyltransferase
MVGQSSEEVSRPATLEDLLSLCRALNDRGAHYVVIGGTAMLNLGFVRATEDIDRLNTAKFRE